MEMDSHFRTNTLKGRGYPTVKVHKEGLVFPVQSSQVYEFSLA